MTGWTLRIVILNSCVNAGDIHWYNNLQDFLWEKGWKQISLRLGRKIAASSYMKVGPLSYNCGNTECVQLESNVKLSDK